MHMVYKEHNVQHFLHSIFQWPVTMEYNQTAVATMLVVAPILILMAVVLMMMSGYVKENSKQM